MSDIHIDRVEQLRNKYKYYSTEKLLRCASTEYIFIRDSYKYLQQQLEEQWVIIRILEKRLSYVNTKKQRK